MKHFRMAAPLVLFALSTFGFGQSDAQKEFDSLKTLAGSWQGTITTTPKEPGVDGKLAQITLRVTSMGNALAHEAHIDTRADHPLTIFYMDDGRLMLTHYCDAGNRPRMVAKPSADGKTVEFEFLDIAGSNQYGHMHHSIITTIDANHHLEDWTFMVGDKPVLAHFDLKRVQ